MNEQRIAELETQLQVERNEHDQREYQVNSLHVDNVELKRQLEIERQITHETIATAVILDNWLALIAANLHVMQHAQSSQLIHEAQESTEKIIAEYEAWQTQQQRQTAVALLSDPDVMKELEAHGSDIKGVPV